MNLKTAVQVHRRKWRQRRDKVAEYFRVCGSLHRADELRCLLFNPTALSMNLDIGARLIAAPAAARREHPERCGWVFDHSRAPRDPPRFMVPIHAKKKRKGALHEPPGEGTGPTGC